MIPYLSEPNRTAMAACWRTWAPWVRDNVIMPIHAREQLQNAHRDLTDAQQRINALTTPTPETP